MPTQDAEQTGPMPHLCGLTGAITPALLMAFLELTISGEVPGGEALVAWVGG